MLSSQGTGDLQLLGLTTIVASCKPLFPHQAAFVVSFIENRLMGEHACQITMLWQGRIHLKLGETIWLISSPEQLKPLLYLKNELNCLIYAVSLAKSVNWFSLKARLERPSARQTPNCWPVWKDSWKPRISKGLEQFKWDAGGATGSRITLQLQAAAHSGRKPSHSGVSRLCPDLLSLSSTSMKKVA